MVISRLIALIIIGVILLAAACDEGGETEVDETTIASTENLTEAPATNPTTETPTLGPILVDPECGCVANEVIVKFASDTPSDEVREILDQFDAHRIKESFDLGGAWVLEVPSENREALLNALDGHSGIEYAEPNFVGGSGG